jgi:hypothetical protein
MGAIGIRCRSAGVLAKVGRASGQQMRPGRPVSTLEQSCSLLSKGLRVLAFALTKSHLCLREHEYWISEVSTSRQREPARHGCYSTSG